MFTVALFTITKNWNQTKYPSMIDWKKKMWYIHSMEYYATIEKKDYVFCGNMDGAGGHYPSQTYAGTED